jgi:hypothetical protein
MEKRVAIKSRCKTYMKIDIILANEGKRCIKILVLYDIKCNLIKIQHCYSLSNVSYWNNHYAFGQRYCAVLWIFKIWHIVSGK